MRVRPIMRPEDTSAVLGRHHQQLNCDIGAQQHTAARHQDSLWSGRGQRQWPELEPAGLGEVPVVADLAEALALISPAPPFTKTPPAGGARV